MFTKSSRPTCVLARLSTKTSFKGENVKFELPTLPAALFKALVLREEEEPTILRRRCQFLLS